MAKVLTAAIGLFALIFYAPLAQAKEYPIGKPQDKSGMEIAAVYLQPIEMDPPGMMKAVGESDVHLEADIKASKSNPNGFAQGDWIPYLVVHYVLTKLYDKQVVKGDLMPMVANDGPHYGDNVKLFGPGKYKLTVEISPPDAHFGRHVDKETGVGPWFKTFSLDYEFVYAGVGKKGTY